MPGFPCFIRASRMPLPLAGALLTAAALSACGGSDEPAGTLRLGGTVTGLAVGKSVVLQNSGADDLRVSENGGFSFRTPLASGAAYAVTVKTQPDGQTCRVAHGSGTATSDVGDVAVDCVAGSTPPPPTPPAPPLASGTAALEGEWINPKVCTPVGGGQSARQLLKLVRQSDTVVEYHGGTLVYGNATCQGAGSALLSPMGSVTFSRIESSPTLAAHWGSWRLITGTTSYLVWAKPGNDKLCLLGDENPSILPTLERVAQSAAVQDQQNACFVRR